MFTKKENKILLKNNNNQNIIVSIIDPIDSNVYYYKINKNLFLLTILSVIEFENY